jgi:hydrogenase maturation protease
MKDILILGLGNFLLKDEGVGVHFVEFLAQEKDIPSYVDIEDGATGGINLLFLMEEYKKVIVIDAMDFGSKPGKVKKVTFDEIRQKKSHLSVSLHGINFFNVIELAKTLLQPLPKIVVIGIQPKDMTEGIQLTDEIKKTYKKVKQLVFEEIKNNE